MFYIKKIRFILYIVLLQIFIIGSISFSTAAENNDIFSETKEKLSTISDKQEKVLQRLFFILQDIEVMERQEEKTQEDIKNLEEDIQNVRRNIQEEETVYKNRRDTLKEVLKSYQRRGPASYLEMILTSDNLSILIRRINIIRDLTKNTGMLLEELEQKRQELEDEKNKLNDTLYSLEKKQEELRKSLLKNKERRDDMEEYLASLDLERSFYEEQLNQIGTAWEEAKKVIIESVSKLYDVLEEGDLPFEKVEVKITLGGVTGSMNEEIFNQVAKEYLTDKEIKFHFYDNKIKIEVPSKQFSLAGSFVIVDDHTLQFEAQEGSFYGMSLTSESIEEIFSNGQLELNLEPVLYGSTLKEVYIKDGYIEIMSKLPLF